MDLSLNIIWNAGSLLNILWNAGSLPKYYLKWWISPYKYPLTWWMSPKYSLEWWSVVSKMINCLTCGQSGWSPWHLGVWQGWPDPDSLMNLCLMALPRPPPASTCSLANVCSLAPHNTLTTTAGGQQRMWACVAQGKCARQLEAWPSLGRQVTVSEPGINTRKLPSSLPTGHGNHTREIGSVSVKGIHHKTPSYSVQEL